MTFDSELNWKSHFDSLIDRCKKDLNIMRYISGTKYGADRKTLLMLYTSLIRSKLDYGCQAYATTASTAQLQRLDRIQSTVLRIVTGAYKSAPKIAVEVECNVLPLNLRRDEMILKYWARSSPLGSNLSVNELFWILCLQNWIKKVE